MLRSIGALRRQKETTNAPAASHFQRFRSELAAEDGQVTVEKGGEFDPGAEAVEDGDGQIVHFLVLGKIPLFLKE
ncbi:hypothetical protein [Pseudophaeobacter arcticus]|jgi:hypothetical protein|uniref:hypothetical protein n=1 Tax=Pseudophaeobacter arcticus TaxID=385492 RepID=UPI0039E3F321